MKSTLFNLEPIQKLINGVGQDVKRFLGKDKGCVVGLGDDGFLYGLGLYQWLRQKNKNLTFTAMDDNGKGLDDEKIKGRKILVVDNDIITGKSYKRTMEAMRAKKDKLKLKEIKFAVLCDRTGLADFSVEGYSAYAPWSLERLDVIDLTIIQALAEDGRKSFVEIAKETKLSPVAVKTRVERLINDGVMKILGFLNMEKVYSVSAHIEIEADSKTINRLIDKFERSPLTYHLVKTSGRYNLIVSIITPNLESVENFIAKEIRSEPSIKHIEVSVGELPIIPKVWNPPIS